MSELISLTQSAINGELQQTVNARELHAFLEVSTAFKDWVSRRIKDYDFIENLDFCSFLSESSGGRPSKEYYITLAMAKELAMVERNEKVSRRGNTLLNVKRSCVKLFNHNQHNLLVN